MSTQPTQAGFVQLPTAGAEKTSFVRLSSALTGYTTQVLAPPLTPIDLAGEYLSFVQGKDAQGLSALLAAWNAIDTGQDPLQQPTGPLQEKILDDPVLGPLARRVIRLWYVSIWYDQEPPPMFGSGTVVSSNAYCGGLVWDAAQAHPMGFSELTFGYWAEPPASPLPPPAT